ncbi:MAG: LamG-like jellyroll fold domain-containing protein [Parcubacteria group bacterium]
MTGNPYKGYAFQTSSTGQLRVYVNGGGTNLSVDVIPANTWVHVATTKEVGGQYRFFINGAECTYALTGTTAPLSATTENLYIGQDTVWNYRFKGSIDEVAIFNRALSSAEILSSYQRGALGLKFQVRNCDDSACSGESFIGPDGTASTYYSELSNTTTGLPALTLTNISSARYFQYQATLTTTATAYTPQINSATLDYTDANHAPNTPTNATPVDMAASINLNPTLTGSAFSDTDSGNTHGDTMWQVDDDANFATPVWTRTAGGAEITTTVNASNGTFANELSGKTELAHNTVYYWRMKYQDNFTGWSEYSTATSFTANVIETPLNSLPVNAEIVQTLTPVLTASDASDQQSGHGIISAQWLIDNGAEFLSPEYDSGEVSYSASKAVPGGILSSPARYYWKVRYKDSSGFWSDYSTATYFNTFISENTVQVNPVSTSVTIDQGDSVNLDIQVLNFVNNAPINSNATATIDIFNPAGTKLVTAGSMNYVAGSNGIYRYTYTVPAVSGSYLYDATVTYGTKLGYGAANFEVRTISNDISAINSAAATEQALQVAERASQAAERASQAAERTAQQSSRAVVANIQNNATDTNVKVTDIQTKTNTIGNNLDVLLGALIVTQSSVNDNATTTASFVTALTNVTDDFYNNSVLTFTSGALNGQARRISDYNGTTKQITVSPALTSAPANADSFTIVKQNVYVEQQLAEHETAQAVSRVRVEDIQTKTTDIQTKATDIQTKVTSIQSTVNAMNTLLQSVDSKIDSLNNNVTALAANLQTVDDNVDSILTKWGSSTAQDVIDDVAAVKTVADNLRASQQLGYVVRLSDAGQVQTTNAYRAKLTVLNYEKQLADAVSAPSVTIYDSARATADNGTMTRLSTGVYEYTYTVPSGATSGLWETVATVNLGGVAPIIAQDYWEVEGAPAQVIINSMSDSVVPAISANITITNEGTAQYEYQYEYCVVAAESNQCGGSDDVAYALAAKLIQPSQNWTTDLSLNVPEPGNYWFKMVVYWGTETSGASRTFTATSTATPLIVSGVNASSASVSDVYAKIVEVQQELLTAGKTQNAYDDIQSIKQWLGILPGELNQPLYKEMKTASAQLNKTVAMLGGKIDPSSAGFKSLFDLSRININDLQDIKNKLSDLRAVSSSTQRIMEQGVTEPVVETWMTFNSVEFNFLIANPLAEKKVLKFKSYLPAEVKPEHVMDLGGLNIEFDSNANSYYVYGDINLGPKESITRKVEIKDIWMYSEDEVATLKKQAENLLAPLVRTQYEAQGAILNNEIESTLDAILINQKEGYRTPQDHIVAHRLNEVKMSAAKQNVEKLKDLVVQAGASQGMVGRVGGIQTFATWGIILAIVFGFCLLAAIIFAMWRHQTMMMARVLGVPRRAALARVGGRRRRGRR